MKTPYGKALDELEHIRELLLSWREKYELEDDGRRFVSVPIEIFEAVLWPPKRKE